MKQTLLVGLGAFVLGLAACGPVPTPPTLVTEVGCVTGSGAEFILTDLDDAGPGTPRPVTEAFLLTGADQQLRAQVGRRVRVTGEADPAKVVDIRILQPMVKVRPVRTAVATGGRVSDHPKVGLSEQLRLQVSHLLVRAAEPTGEQCE